MLRERRAGRPTGDLARFAVGTALTKPRPSSDRPMTSVVAPSRRSLDPRTPVLIGVGTASDHAEPAELMARATEQAAADAGVPGLLPRVDRIAVPQGSWSYPDPARLVAERIGATGARTHPGRAGHPPAESDQRGPGRHRGAAHPRWPWWWGARPSGGLATSGGRAARPPRRTSPGRSPTWSTDVRGRCSNRWRWPTGCGTRCSSTP